MAVLEMTTHASSEFTRAQILKAISEGRSTPWEIQEKLQIRQSCILQHLIKLHDREMVNRVCRGVYQLTDKGKVFMDKYGGKI